MDPDTALENIRGMVSQLQSLLDSEDEINVYSVAKQASQLIDTFHGLDQWISKGGFLPKDWSVTQ